MRYTITLDDSTKTGSELLNMALKAASRTKTIGVIENVPNSETLKAIDEIESGKSKKASSASELFNSI